jgi:hypothetical protein
MKLTSVLRTGAAHFSASGLKRQDNDLIVTKDAQAAARFKHAFEARFCERRGHCARRAAEQIAVSTKGMLTSSVLSIAS